MKIVFATAHGLTSSTTIGRIFPLVQEFDRMGHSCIVLALSTTPSRHDETPLLRKEGKIFYVGREPFHRTPAGKKRLRGIALIFNMLATALRTAWTLLRLKPDVVIISKSLPSNTLGTKYTHSFLHKRMLSSMLTTLN